MPKKSQPIPDWIKSIQYPTEKNPEEFAYQIFLRRSCFNGTWRISEKYINNEKAKNSIINILSNQMMLRSSFETLKTASPKINAKTGKPILTSVMQRKDPLALALAGLSQLTQDYIPEEMPIIGINLQYSNEKILREITKHLKTLRRRNLPVVILDTEDLILPSNKEIINDIYNKPTHYLEKWTREKTLQAFDLALWRHLTGNTITITEIVNFLELQDDNQWRKTTLKRIDEIMLPGIAEAIICGTTQA